MDTETSLLQDAKIAIQIGDKLTARRLLLQIVAQKPQHETALLWLSAIAETPEREQEYIKRVLAINPQNELAISHLPKPPEPPEPPNKDQSPNEYKTVIYVLFRLRVILYYCVTTVVFIGCLEFAWLLAKGTINLNKPSGWYIVGGLLIGGLDHALIFLISTILGGLLTISLFLAEISAKLTLGRRSA